MLRYLLSGRIRGVRAMLCGAVVLIFWAAAVLRCAVRPSLLLRRWP